MMWYSKSGLPTFVRRFRDDRRGASIVIFAVALPVMIGFLGLGSEVAYWYVNSRDLQTASDFGAFTAAMELRGNSTENYAKIQGQSEALQNGADATTDTITVNIPPSSGAIMTSDAAEVVIVRNLPRLFSGMFVSTDMTVTSRGVAQYSDGAPACILSLSREADHAIDVTGSADVTLTGCDVVSNSSSANAVRVTGAADLTTGCLSAAGGVDASSGLTLTECAAPKEGASTANDPYADLPMPDLSGPCATLPGDNIYSPGRYCGGLTLQADETLQPGVYIIDGGDFRVNAAADVDGTGVTIILTGGGTVSINGAAEVELSAPTDPADPYAGILFYQDRDEPDGTNTISGNSETSFEGIFYFPSQSVTFSGSAGSGPGCMLVVANKVKMTGSADMGNDCAGSAFFGEVQSPGYVRLVD